jgi:protein TonB
MSVAAALHVHDDERLHLRRWIAAALVVTFAHAALVTAFLLLRQRSPEAGMPGAPILIELSPLAASPQTEADVAPGPQMTESEYMPEPEPQPPAPVEESIVAVPPAPNPEIVIPPKQEKPAEQKAEAKPKPPEPIKKQQKQATKAAPRTTANPRMSQRAHAATAPSPGTASSARATADYRALLAAHLQRHKQYPAAARAAGESGTAVIAFTVDRNGRVLSRSLARSSGSRNLDAEVLAMIGRAQPMPRFPADMPQSRMAFSVPIRFSIH